MTNFANLSLLLEAAVLANECFWEQKDDALQFYGDSVDVALLEMAQKNGLKRSELLEKYIFANFIPYESASKFAAGIYVHKKNGKVHVFVKGAAEALLEMCSYQIEGEELVSLRRGAILSQENDYSARSYRVLAFAYGILDPDDAGEVIRNLSDRQDDVGFITQKNYTRSDLKNLIFLGIVGMHDPIREEAISAVEKCKRAGIKVIIITGDHPNTAYAVAQKLLLLPDDEGVITGQEICRVTACGSGILDEVTKKHSVYARMGPKQKLDVVSSFIRNGDFVAVTGDGINDALALKRAHVGIAMGKNGTDVARESAAIVLADDNFTSIVSGIEEGRAVYANIRKIVFFLIAISISEVLMYLGAIMLGLPAPLTAIQLLWVNFANSIVQDIGLALEPIEGHELDIPPRDPKEPIMDQIMIYRLLVVISVIGAITLGEFYWMIKYAQYALEAARNLVLLQFVILGNVLVLNCRSESTSLFTISFRKNPFLLYGVLAAQAMHVVAMYIPCLQDMLEVAPVSLGKWCILCVFAFIPMCVIETEKYIHRLYRKKR